MGEAWRRRCSMLPADGDSPPPLWAGDLARRPLVWDRYLRMSFVPSVFPAPDSPLSAHAHTYTTCAS
jgi:hypothetical protein